MTTPYETACREQDDFERDSELIAAEVSYLPEVNGLPDRFGEDEWPHVERALVAVGRHYRGSLAATEEVERLTRRIAALRTTIVGLVDAHDYTTLDRGIGTKTEDGKRWLDARQQVFFSDAQ